VDGSEAPRVLIAEDGSRPGNAMWSPDATRILVQARFDVPYPDIYTLSADGTDPRRLTDDLGNDLCPHWGIVTPPPLEGRVYTLENFDGLVSIFIDSETPLRSGSVCLAVDPAMARVLEARLGRDLNGLEPRVAVARDVLDADGRLVVGAVVLDWSTATSGNPGEGSLVPGRREVAQLRLERLLPCPLDGGIGVSFLDGFRVEPAGPWKVNSAASADGSSLEVGTGRSLIVPCSSPFHRGDANADGEANLTDVIFLLEYLFRGGDAPTCLEAAEVNEDGKLNLTDGVYLLLWLFRGGPEPAAPGPPGTVGDLRPCGYDLFGSPGALGCDRYAPCEG
jgi:hypothetical protein